MYTQCPECSVAFRITAEILRQAAGKVRCGGCGVAFNALNHLSEQKPQAPARPAPDPQLPELKPEDPPELEADTPPQTISAEQSAALLKTLDQLAGSDIRIEDTGVEWRVLDEDEEADESGETEPDPRQAEAEAIQAPSDTDLIADTGSLKFFIEEETEEEPVDNGTIDEVLEESPTPIDEFLTDTPPVVDSPEIFEEMRFDDNTPLPDDFDLDAPSPPPEAAVVTPELVTEPEEAQVDLELGDPDEWEDLLGEVVEPIAGEDADAAPATEEPVVEDRPGEEEPLDVDTQFAIQAEAMGIDLSGMHETVEEAAAESEAEPEKTDPAETTIDEDLIAAAFETEAAAREDDVAAEEDAVVDEEIEEDEPEPEEDVEPGDAADEEEFVAEIDAELEALEQEDNELELLDELEGEAVDEGSLRVRLDDEETGTDIPPIPEMSEEEKTINMLIDQDLLSVAVEDEDGFASTIIQKQPDKKAEKVADDLERDKKPKKDKKEKKRKAKEGEEDKDRKKEKPSAPPLIETIIMEGETVLAEADEKKSEENRRLGDEMKARRAEEEKRREEARGPSRSGMMAAAAALVLVLILQVVHQSREALATVPAFVNTVGPVYRMLGKPLTPAWDIAGWRFEATKGSTDEAEQVLTIYSRIGNKSEEALPYPLVHVSLTDRFEDIIGSRVLEPREYLAGDDDPRELVAAGNTFNAVIAIESPSPDATGFKLNVCYRLASGQLRCAVEDFK